MHDVVDRQLDCLGDSTRRGVLRLLRTGPKSVGEIATHFPVSRPAISQHLRILTDAGFVSAEPNGRQRIYQCRPEGFTSLRAFVDGFWQSALDRFQQHVKSRRAERRRSA